MSSGVEAQRLAQLVALALNGQVLGLGEARARPAGVRPVGGSSFYFGDEAGLKFALGQLRVGARKLERRCF